MNKKFLVYAFFLTSTLAHQSHSNAEIPCAQKATLLVPVPTISDPSNLMRYLKRDTALYLAEVFNPSVDISSVTETQSELSLGCFSDLPFEVQNFLQDSNNHSAEIVQIDAWALRQNIGALYKNTRLKRFGNFEIPQTLTEFSQKTEFQNWWGQLLQKSRAKAKTRKLFHSPDGYSPKMSVAQTYDTEDGNLNAPIRETEIMIERSPGSNQWDFIVYDTHGNLAIESEFPRNSILPAPSVCMTCHYEPATRTFSTFMRPSK